MAAMAIKTADRIAGAVEFIGMARLAEIRAPLRLSGEIRRYPIGIQYGNYSVVAQQVAVARTINSCIRVGEMSAVAR